MHELQEKYLLIAYNDINFVQNLLDLYDFIKNRQSEIAGEQQKLYRQHGIEKSDYKK